MVYRLSCSAARGISPSQWLNHSLLHWQVNSLSPSYQGSPTDVCILSDFFSTVLSSTVQHIKYEYSWNGYFGHLCLISNRWKTFSTSSKVIFAIVSLSIFFIRLRKFPSSHSLLRILLLLLRLFLLMKECCVLSNNCPDLLRLLYDFFPSFPFNVWIIAWFWSGKTTFAFLR